MVDCTPSIVYIALCLVVCLPASTPHSSLLLQSFLGLTATPAPMQQRALSNRQQQGGGAWSRCRAPSLRRRPALLPQHTAQCRLNSSTRSSICNAVAAEATTDPYLYGYICSGPLLGPCGLTPEQVQQDMATWQKLAKRLSDQLGFDHSNLDPVQRLRIYHYYLPVYFWVQHQLEGHRKEAGSQPATPLMLGISAPQGCGKTTIVEQLQELFTWLGCRVASVSIDDFYLTRADQAALAASNPDNRLLQLRGNAGSHDLALGTQVLHELRTLTQPSASAAVPRYDKSAFQGLGDRAPQEVWPRVEGPLDLVLFEGWMLGFRPLGQDAAAAVDPNLAQVDAALSGYEAAWDALVDAWLVIRIQDPQVVYGWRLQAEQAMRAAGKPGMTDEQIADFVSRYIPAYTAYLPGLYAQGPTTSKAGRTLVIEVDQKRAPVQQQPAPLS